MKKRFLSLILSATLLAGLMPVNIQAQEADTEPLQTGATISDASETDVTETDEEILVEDTLEVEANQVRIDATNFPDENFRKYIKENFDANNDDIVDDIENVKEIYVNNEVIHSLKGIELFWALERLDCYNNQLTSLDVSKNIVLEYLDCDHNQLTNLDVSKNTELEYLLCEGNSLPSLDVSKNTELEYLDCERNSLTSLDVSKNTKLYRLDCGNNQLISLDVNKNTALKNLRCSFNQLTSLDVSKNTALMYLSCGSNDLPSLDVSKNIALEELHCNNSQLTSLDVSKNTELNDLYCDYNQLTSLDVSKNVELSYLICNNNQLTSLDVSKNTDLHRLECGNNQLTNLDMSQNTELWRLYCSYNQLTNLDVSNCTELSRLICNNNQLINLDVSNCTELIVLNLDSNIITDISALNLDTLNIYVPQLKGTIDLSDMIGIEKYMLGSGWDADTKKITYELEPCTVGYASYTVNNREPFVGLRMNDIDQFSNYQGYNFYRDVYGNITCYDYNGNPVINEFKCDGTYTYYFQADGTAMRNRLTYHPDGVHVIYFDENGHEVFSNFHHVEKSIAGQEVDDLCFFDVYGYMYVDVMTYDQAGENLYYVNPYGVIEQGKWFEFSDTCVWAGTTNKVGKGYGYANADGTLMVNTHTYDWLGRFVYLQGNGHIQ